MPDLQSAVLCSRPAPGADGSAALSPARPRSRRNTRFLRGPAQACQEEKEMKYFKPDLLARCRSLDDEVAEAAAQEWEQAITDYRARIKAIRLRLPTGARRLF